MWARGGRFVNLHIRPTFCGENHPRKGPEIEEVDPEVIIRVDTHENEVAEMNDSGKWRITLERHTHARRCGQYSQMHPRSIHCRGPYRQTRRGPYKKSLSFLGGLPEALARC